MSATQKKHVFYCFYLNTYRTDAYLRSLGASVDTLQVMDFSPLRMFYRGKTTDIRNYRQKQLKQYGNYGAQLTYRAYGGTSRITPGCFNKVRFVWATLCCTFVSLITALQILFSKINHVVFYNGHALFTPIWLACRIKGCTYSTDLGDILYLIDNPNQFTRRLEIAFLKHSRHIIPVSQPFKEHLIKDYQLPAERISILSAAIPLAFITAFDAPRNQARREDLRQRIGAAPNERIIVYSGGIWKKDLPGIGIVDVQGVDSLCQAFEALNHKGKTTWLVLLGYSVDASELDRYRNGKWQAKFVELGAYTPGDSLQLEALGGADLLGLPSYPCDTYRLYDRFKTIEYLAAGKPVLAADTAINHHILREAGLYFEEGSVESMVQTVIDAPIDSTNHFATTNNKRVHQLYNWEKRIEAQDIPAILFGNQMIERY